MAELGRIALFGSGESAPGAHRIHRRIMQQLRSPVRSVIVETPAGFEPNSAGVAQGVARYLDHHLQEFQPHIDIIPARKRGTAHSPDDPRLAPPIFAANYLFMGPGSPTYAARQLRDSFIWHSLLAQHRRGAALVFSSATTIAVSRRALPVYEIYKVGEDLHWKDGLDFFASFGLSLVVVPHWNNNDGGEELDTSRCYMGQARYRALIEMLDRDVTILGIDENTGIIINPATGVCEVVGAGGAIVIRDGQRMPVESGGSFSAQDLGPWRLPEGSDDIPQAIWDAMAAADAARIAAGTAGPPAAVLEKVEAREQARNARDWARADQLRDEVLALGWQINDTPEGPEVVQA